MVSRVHEVDFARTLQSLKETLKLKQVPERIECFDISNIFGKQAVGSMVTFEQGNRTNPDIKDLR